MIIDMCTRCWTGRSPWRGDGMVAPQGGLAEPPHSAAPEDHARAIRSVTAAAVIGYRSDRLGIELPIETATAFAEVDADRRLPFVGVDLAHADALNHVDDAAEQGAVGIAIAPADQGVRPTDEAAIAVLERCARRELVVHVSNPGLRHPHSVLEFANPSHFDEAARILPALRLVLGDIGRVFFDEALVLCAKHEGVCGEISFLAGKPALMARVLTEAYEREAIHKLLFASGYPMATPETAIEQMYRVQASSVRDFTPAVPRVAIRSLIERDALSLLGLESAVCLRERAGRKPAPATSAATQASLTPTVVPAVSRWRAGATES